MYKDEIEIDLIDLLKYLLKKWKLLILLMIVFAILLDGFYFIKESKQVKETVITPAEEIDLSQSENIIKNKPFYDEYVNQIDTYSKYFENSLYAQIDGSKVPTMKYTYSIQSENAGSAQDAISVIDSTIKSDAHLEKASAAINADKEYLPELITVKAAGADYYSDSRSKTMIVTIIAPTKEICDSLSDNALETINNAIEVLKTSVPTATITLLTADYSESSNIEITNANSRSLANYVTAQKNLDTLLSTLTPAEKEYLTQTKLSDDEDKEEAAAPELPNPNLLNKKYIALGLVLGAFVYCLILGCLYIFNKRLKTASDLNHLGIDELIGKEINRKAITNDAVIEAYSNLISVIASKNNVTNLLLVSNTNNSEIANLLNATATKVKANMPSLSATVLPDFANGTPSLTTLDQADSAIFFEEIMNSTYEDISNSVSLCKQCSIKVLGAVTIR